MKFFALILLWLISYTTSLYSQSGSWLTNPTYSKHSESLENIREVHVNGKHDVISSVQQDSVHAVIKHWNLRSGALLDSVVIGTASGALGRDALTYTSVRYSPAKDSVIVEVYSAVDAHLILRRLLDTLGSLKSPKGVGAIYDSTNSTLYAFSNYTNNSGIVPNTTIERDNGTIYSIRNHDSVRAWEHHGQVRGWDYSTSLNSFLSTNYWSAFFLFVSGGFWQERPTTGATSSELSGSASHQFNIPLLDASARCSYQCDDSVRLFQAMGKLSMNTSTMRDSVVVLIDSGFQAQQYCADTQHFFYVAEGTSIIVRQLESQIAIDTLRLPTGIAFLNSINADSLLVIGSDFHIYIVTTRSSFDKLALFSSSKRLGYTGLNVNFVHNYPSSARAWRWDFGDGTIDSTSGPRCSHVYTKSGQFTCSLQITTAVFTKQNYSIKNGVTILRPLSADFRADTSWGPAPLQVHLTNTSQGNILSVLWDFGDGTRDTAANPSHVFAKQQCHNVRVSVRDSIQTLSLLRECLVYPSDIPVHSIQLSDAKKMRSPVVPAQSNQEFNAAIACQAFGAHSMVCLVESNVFHEVYVDYKSPMQRNTAMVEMLYEIDTLYNVIGHHQGVMDQPGAYYSLQTLLPRSSLIALEDSLVAYFPFNYFTLSYGNYASVGFGKTVYLPQQASRCVGGMLKHNVITLSGSVFTSDSSRISFRSTVSPAPQTDVYVQGHALRCLEGPDSHLFCLSQRGDSTYTILINRIDTAFHLFSIDTLKLSTSLWIRDIVRMSSDKYLISGTTLNTPVKHGYLVTINSKGKVLSEHEYSRWRDFGRITPLSDGGALLLNTQSESSTNEYQAFCRIDENCTPVQDFRIQDSSLFVRDMCLSPDGSVWLVGANRQKSFAYIQHVKSDTQLLSSVEEDAADSHAYDEIFIRPQPAKDELQILLPQSHIDQVNKVSVFSPEGQEVEAVQLQLDSRSLSVRCTSLNSGVYVVVVRLRNGELLRQTFVVSH